MKKYIQTNLLLIPFLFIPFLGTGCASLARFLNDATSQNSSQEAAQDQDAQRKQRLAQALAERELTLGMGMRDVHSLWGDPRSVEAAGFTGNGNERWIYYDGLSSRWSMSTARIVYFESGKVVGWETNLAR